MDFIEPFPDYRGEEIGDDRTLFTLKFKYKISLSNGKKELLEKQRRRC